MVFHSLWGWEKRYFALPGSFLNFPPRAPPGTAVPRTPAFQRNRAIEFSSRHARKEESGRGHPAPRKGTAAPLTPASGEHSIALLLRRQQRPAIRLTDREGNDSILNTVHFKRKGVSRETMGWR